MRVSICSLFILAWGCTLAPNAGDARCEPSAPSSPWSARTSHFYLGPMEPWQLDATARIANDLWEESGVGPSPAPSIEELLLWRAGIQLLPDHGSMPTPLPVSPLSSEQLAWLEARDWVKLRGIWLRRPDAERLQAEAGVDIQSDAMQRGPWGFNGEGDR